MSRTIYLLRHGQTKLNLERRMQGHCDSALTELGVAQARAMGATLRAELGSLDNWPVFASPLGRAMQTAELVCAELGLASRSIQPEPRLIEVGFGEWEQQQVQTLHTQYPHLATLPDWYFQAPGCEPYADVVQRLENWLADDTLPDQLIVVAHGLLGRILRGIYAQLSPAALWAQDMPQDAFFRLQNGSLTRIECLPLPVATV
ncbi:histidine phosphatase family protein [uncultured Deefgea sp.]|uniref:histidine phosphatase family protein n=1 Tax=uncultured Deefgea sp. TaxID=1304914 RepID=UPI00260D2F2F|nr:histidine phosphatase family protein [uncultured Deefgea sp.]